MKRKQVKKQGLSRESDESPLSLSLARNSSPPFRFIQRGQINTTRSPNTHLRSYFHFTFSCIRETLRKTHCLCAPFTLAMHTYLLDCAKIIIKYYYIQPSGGTFHRAHFLQNLWVDGKLLQFITMNKTIRKKQHQHEKVPRKD